jgi:prepilin peptidase CpaA
MAETAFVSAALWSVCLAGLLGAAATDLRSRRIPNRIVLLVLTAGLVLQLLRGWPAAGIGLAAALAVFVALAVLAHYGFMGEGDVKLIAVMTLLVPPHGIAPLLLAIALAGGVLSCVYLALRHGLRRRTPQTEATSATSIVRLMRGEAARIAAGEPMPYALAILGGTVLYVLSEASHVVA